MTPELVTIAGTPQPAVDSAAVPAALQVIEERTRAVAEVTDAPRSEEVVHVQPTAGRSSVEPSSASARLPVRRRRPPYLFFSRRVVALSKAY